MPSHRPVLLLGAATPLGEQLLLRLGLTGHEVVAHVSDSDPVGQTGEFAVQVVRGAPSEGAAAERPSVVVAAAPVGDAEVGAVLAAAQGAVQRWVQCAPLADARAVAAVVTQAERMEAAGVLCSRVLHAPTFADLARVVRATGFHARWQELRTARLANPVAEADVAAAAVRALETGAHLIELGGPETLAWRTVRALLLGDAPRSGWFDRLAQGLAELRPPVIAAMHGTHTLETYGRRRASAGVTIVAASVA